MPFGKEKATLKLTGEHNRRMVFHLLRRHRRLSRQRIADSTGLHRSTLSKIMSEFLERKLVREVGQVVPLVKRVGKRQTLLEIRGDVGWTLGVSITNEWTRMVVVDAAGALIADSQMKLGDDISLVPAQLKAHADTWLADDRRPAGRFFGIGVAVPGIADTERGVLIYSDHFRIRNHPLADAITAAFGVPASIDNDARLEATAYMSQPEGNSDDDFVFLYLNHRPQDGGVVFTDFGSAIVIEGRIHRGAHRGAGELWGRLPAHASVADRGGRGAHRIARRRDQRTHRGGGQRPGSLHRDPGRIHGSSMRGARRRRGLAQQGPADLSAGSCERTGPALVRRAEHLHRDRPRSGSGRGIRRRPDGVRPDPPHGPRQPAALKAGRGAPQILA